MPQQHDSYGLLGVWGSCCKCLGSEATPFIDVLMPTLLETLEKQVSML